jgi:hypothetical protein
LSASDGARAVLQLEQDEQVHLIELVNAETAAWVIEQLPDEAAACLSRRAETTGLGDVEEAHVHFEP